jgi:ribosomal protein S13
METKKAFRKLPNIEQAITALSNLKGVGTTMASALIAAASPDIAPFMADEVLKAIPDIEGIDYTAREYLKFVTHIESTRNRLNSECNGDEWTAHS